MAADGPSGGGVENGDRACKNPWRHARGKWFPSRFCWLLCGEVYPAGCHGPRQWEIAEADSRGRAAPDPGQRGRRCRIRAGLESEGRHLILLVADAQREVVQGAANDGVGAIVQQLEWRYVAIPPHEYCRCVGEVIGKLRRRPVAMLCLVAECSAVLSVLENCSRKVLEGSSGESKNWPGKRVVSRTLPERGWSRRLPWPEGGKTSSLRHSGRGGRPSDGGEAFYHPV